MPKANTRRLGAPLGRTRDGANSYRTSATGMDVTEPLSPHPNSY